MCMLLQLNALACKATGKGTLSGEVLLNGHTYRDRDFRHWGVYVMQAEPMLNTATVSLQMPLMQVRQTPARGSRCAMRACLLTGRSVVQEDQKRVLWLCEGNSREEKWGSDQELLGLSACAGVRSLSGVQNSTHTGCVGAGEGDHHDQRTAAAAAVDGLPREAGTR